MAMSFLIPTSMKEEQERRISKEYKHSILKAQCKCQIQDRMITQQLIEIDQEVERITSLESLSLSHIDRLASKKIQLQKEQQETREQLERISAEVTQLNRTTRLIEFQELQTKKGKTFPYLEKALKTIMSTAPARADISANLNSLRDDIYKEDYMKPSTSIEDDDLYDENTTASTPYQKQQEEIEAMKDSMLAKVQTKLLPDVPLRATHNSNSISSSSSLLKLLQSK